MAVGVLKWTIMLLFTNSPVIKPIQLKSSDTQLKKLADKMCKTYNTIGSLNTLKSHLHSSNIHDFKSLKEVMDFQSTYPTIRQQLFLHHEN